MKKIVKEIVKTNKWEPLWEAVKSPLRLLVLALIPFAIAYLTELPYSWAGVITLLLKFCDTVLHEYGKAAKSENLTLGITRF